MKIDKIIQILSHKGDLLCLTEGGEIRRLKAKYEGDSQVATISLSSYGYGKAMGYEWENVMEIKD